jgi:hypothetical protein
LFLLTSSKIFFLLDNSQLTILCLLTCDPLGISVKDLHTRNILLRCNSSGSLYTL